MAINVPTPPARATAAARSEWIGYAARLRSLLADVPQDTARKCASRSNSSSTSSRG
ncbi:hypothetical protein LMG29542_08363 [Paraburkholderia humisilvae]|uniref:Uncharacterized protein n=1 Tax=Paraburkholderia humisilvae TaxID=627669 RepID=A0A6J5FAZ9_9BURK|nr:hypothetical protein LMG29542_08363 [Paraburkholderia humisilvae]